MRTITFFTISLFISINLHAGTYSGGSGTSGDPYKIATTADLIELSNTSGDWGAYFVQTTDITFGSDPTQVDWDGDGISEHGASGDDTYGLTPIGQYTDSEFTGSYDGQNHTISNLYINRPDEINVGLFGFVTSGASITNLNIEGGTVTGEDDVGALIGDIDNSTVDNCSASTNVTCTGNDSGNTAGGLIGIIDQSTVSNSFAMGSVSANKYAGGLVGTGLSGSIDNCYAEGTVESTTDGYAGGLIGDNDDASISDCHATGNVSGQSNVGGLLGDNEAPVSNCYATGQITATGDDVGGLIGDHDVSVVTNCFATGNVDADDYVGGLIGYVHGGATVRNCYAKGTVNADQNVGGIAGLMEESSSIQSSYAKNTTINGTYDVGGIVGDIDTGSIENSFAVNTVSASSSTENSGIAGYTSGGATITASFFDKTVNTGMPDENDYGRTTSDMQTACTYLISDWNFAPSGGTTGTWSIDEPGTDNNGYPALAWQGLTNSYTTNCQATNIAFSAVQPNQMTISWNNGGGGARTVFMKQASTGTASPVDGTTYAANTAFGDGDQIGTTGWYCVYNETGSQVTVTELTQGTGYIVHVTEYNGSAGSENYLTTSATYNPNTQTTKIPGLWTGADPADNNWNTPGNWDDGQVPGTDVNVTIPDTGNDPVISAAATCQNITIENNSTLTINSSQTLNVTGNFTLNDGGDFTNNGALKFSGSACELSDNRATKSSLGNILVKEQIY